MCWWTDEQVQGLFLPQEPGVDLVSVPQRVGQEGGAWPIVACSLLVNMPCGNFASLKSSRYHLVLWLQLPLSRLCIMLGVPYVSSLLWVEKGVRRNGVGRDVEVPWDPCYMVAKY